MSQVINFIKLDFNRSNNVTIPTIEWDQGSRFVRVQLQNNNQNVDITGSQVVITVIRNDLEEIIESCNILNAKEGLIEFEISKSMVARQGDMLCQLKLSDNDSLLSSQLFKVSVNNTLMVSLEESRSDMDVLIHALGEVQDIDNRFSRTELKIDESYEKVNAQLSYRTSISVKEYGATGDGITDDTQAFLNALNENTSIFVPNGHYIINQELNISGKSFVGESHQGVLLDMSHCTNAEYCIKVEGFRTEVKQFRLKCNPNISSQFAIYIYYLTDSGVIRDITVQGSLDRSDSASNGLKIEKTWYADIQNIRIKHIQQSGFGIKLINGVEGGVNAVTFKNLFVGGGLHSVVFDGNSKLATEAIKFIGCTFEGTEKTIINNKVSNAQSIEFDSCYFENNYVNTTDIDVPVLCVNNSSIPIVFNNCIHRTPVSGSGRYLSEGNVSMMNFLNAIYYPLHTSTGYEKYNSYCHNVIGVGILGRGYNSGLQTKVIDYVDSRDAQYMYKKIHDKKTIVLDTNIDLFEIKVPVNSINSFSLKMILAGSNNYVNAMLNYSIFMRNRGSNFGTDIILESSKVSAFSGIEDFIELSASDKIYDSSTDTSNVIVRFKVLHRDLVGDLTFEVDGFTSNVINATNQRRICRV